MVGFKMFGAHFVASLTHRFFPASVFLAVFTLFCLLLQNYIYINLYVHNISIYIYNTYLYMRIKSSSAYSNQKGHVSPQVSLGLM